MNPKFTKIALLVKFFFICSFIQVHAQDTIPLPEKYTWRVFFRDKGPDKFEQGSPLYNRTRELHSPRAHSRRLKVLSPDSLFSFEDAPLYQPYLDSLEKLTGRIRLRLRWDNYAVVDADSALAQQIQTISFVRAIQRTASKQLALSTNREDILLLDGEEQNSRIFLNNCGEFFYGISFRQLEMLNIPSLHQMGITGEGILTGFLDTGFRWRFHESTRGANVLAEYDFVFGDSLTANDSSDTGGQDGHGTLVFSTVAGNMPDTLIGAAPSAEFLLAKTEDVRSERHIEEDNYAAAIEWLEAHGADISSSSLGYDNFNFPDESYEYFTDINGRTAISTRAVNRAVARGMVCLSAAGNSGSGGPMGRTISAPSDADSVIAVAAIRADTLLPVGFSSRGPRGDNRLKPDIAAQGVAVVCAGTGSPRDITMANGTSLSTPLMAGATTLLMSMHPKLRPWEVREILYRNSSQYDKPDTAVGHGVPDIYRAIRSAGLAIAPVSAYPVVRGLRVACHLISPSPYLGAALYVNFIGDNFFSKFPMRSYNNSTLFYADIPREFFRNRVADAYILAEDGLTRRRLPDDESAYFPLSSGLNAIPCGINPDQLPHEPFIAGNRAEVFGLVSDGRLPVQVQFEMLESSSVQVNVYSSIGEEVFSSGSETMSAGVGNVFIPTASLASGAYYTIIRHSGETSHHAFIIVR